MKKKYFVISILSVIATINAAYLTYIAYSTSSGFCDISETFSCANALSSPETQIFGVPFPAIALIVYPIIFLIAFFSHKKNRDSFKILLGISGGGILFNSYFIYQEYLLGAYCPLCLLCSIIIITIFVLSFMETFKK